MDIGVDNVMLEKARTLQRYLPVGRRTDIRVRCLDDIPWLVVRTFEHLTGNDILTHEKPFSTLTEQSQTLQQIIDTLERALRLPLSHVTGVGVARLDRRQLEDLLQILIDLARHCFPEVCDSANKESGRVNVTADERLTVSQLTREHSSDATCTPRLSALAFESPKDSTNRAASRVDDIPAYIEMAPTAINAIPSGHTTQEFKNSKDSMKRKAPGEHDIPAYIEMNPSAFDAISSRQTRRDDCDSNACDQTEKSTNVKGFYILEPEQESSYHNESLNLFLEPSKPTNQHNGVLIATRHEPYSTSRRKRTVSEQKKTTPNVEALRSTSRAKRNGAICRKPSVKSFSSPLIKVSHQKVSSPLKQRLPLLTNARRQADVGQSLPTQEVKHARCRTASRACSDLTKVSNNEKQTGAFASNKDRLTKLKSVVGLNTIRSGSKTRNPLGNKMKADSSAKAPKRHLHRGQPHSVSSPKPQDRKRKPSVVSTKVRRHSRTGCTGTPGCAGSCHRPIRRGDISPQTTSLCSSLKLLEEFDYVKRRLAQIDRKIAEYELAIQELKEERVRLQYVISHVHRQAGRAVQEGSTPKDRADECQ
ncbi:uncharacterized protein LOC127860827 isoform X2 [Dreissena polymorpha]|uniref:Uncharacterized protein n=1 Tax=Dreissena polymorpha TaxID=45954 RepID=A0A9D3YGK6_DREPO|nr:uncharacterized protein LOC127860827 isoform X2 [Dreissena polymorpha]KAH3698920.1 hypothetical protein DPMN_073865 [Dreissena polymorpha]